MKSSSFLISMVFLCSAAMALPAHAQRYSNEYQGMIDKVQSMNPEAMKKQLDQMQQCMSSIGNDALAALESRGKEMGNRIDSLCAAGKVKEAEALAANEGKAFMSDPTIQKLKRCSASLAAQLRAQSRLSSNPNTPICEQ